MTTWRSRIKRLRAHSIGATAIFGSSEVARIYLWSFALRFLAGLTAWLMTRYYGVPLMEDAMTYEALGAQVADEWLSGKSSTWLQWAMQDARPPWLMVFTIGAFYYAMGGVRAVPLLIAFYAFLTAWTPVVSYRIARELGVSPQGAKLVGWLVAVSPGFAFWSGALYKDGLVYLALSIGLFNVLLLQRRWRGRSLLVVGACIVALCLLRFYLALVLSFGVCLALFLVRLRERKPGAAFTQSFVAAILVLTIGAAFSERSRAVVPIDLQQPLGRIQVFRDHQARSAASGYLPEARVSTPSDALRFLPVGLAYFLTVPLPWHLGSLRQNLALFETLFWLALYPVILIGMSRGLRKNFRGSLTLIVAGLLLCVFYALFSGNIGMTYRMRMQVWLLWAVFVGWGWERLRERKLEEVAKMIRPARLPQ